jgi:hypothetical protein
MSAKKAYAAVSANEGLNSIPFVGSARASSSFASCLISAAFRSSSAVLRKYSKMSRFALEAWYAEAVAVSLPLIHQLLVDEASLHASGSSSVSF